MQIKTEEFGQLKSGEQVIKYMLINDNLQVNILNYGGIITEIYAPDKEGHKENVVLGFDNIKDYEESSNYFGAIIGRYAGRIEKGCFNLKGKTYELSKNENEHTLHGGEKGLDKRIWEVTKIDSGIELSYFSPHLEEGFPGNVKFTVQYKLNNNELIIEYTGKPDQATIISLTNHSYFNLSGQARRSITGHKVRISADEIICLDQNSIPTGGIREVSGTPFNFRKLTKVGKRIDDDCQQLNYTAGYDHPFIFSEEREMLLTEEYSGRALEVVTDQPVVVFYTGNKLSKGKKLNSGVELQPRLGLCLETQEYPNAVNINNFPLNIYQQENKYSAQTKYKFYTDGQ